MKFVEWLMRNLVPLVLGALFVGGLLLLSGCAHVRPDAITLAGVHQSVPFKGPGPAPFGDDERSAESNLDGFQLGVEWGGKHWFADTGLTYALEETNMQGGPWHFTARMGLRLRLGQRPPRRAPVGEGPFGPELVPLIPDDPDPWDQLNPRPKSAK